MTNVTMYWEGRELQWDPQHMDVRWMIVIEDYTHCRGMEEFWQGIGRTEAKFLQCSMYWVLSQNGDKIAPQSLTFDIGQWSDVLLGAFNEYVDEVEAERKRVNAEREKEGLPPKSRSARTAAGANRSRSNVKKISGDSSESVA